MTNQYAGVVFSLEGLPDSSGPARTFDFGFGEALNNTHNNGIPTANILDIAFTAPVGGVSFLFNNYGCGVGCGAATTYTAYDTNNAVVSTGSLQLDSSFHLITVFGSNIADLKLDNHKGNAPWIFGIQSLTYTVAAVPEPSTWAMLLIGFAGIGFAAYRKTSNAKTQQLPQPCL